MVRILAPEVVAMDEATTGTLYGEGARHLQDHFDSRRLADRLEGLTVHDELDDGDRALIGAQSFFLLATVDADGWPDVSYKGGEPGFVRVVDGRTLRFPLFDGNGMFRSAGNISDDGRVALLFIDVGKPWRLRVHGRAEVSTDPSLVGGFHGARAVVTVHVGRLFPNCGRYIHGFVDGDISDFVPRPGHEPPVPDWKRIPVLNEVLPAGDPALS
ncbi:MAG TPA: pyridoxamine 5'-phosphate oxidase family protein [Acidimicrobiales bacterium]|nr:pyridoxamine 5'-phosphate oxidase family protein [Acidimicrobiales bacterium]